eukprot:3503750-Prymnesium_polylepis.1
MSCLSQGRRVSLAASELSEAPTFDAQMTRSFSVTDNDLDSPQLVRSEPPAERKVPSCPQKAHQGSNHGKRQGMPPPPPGEEASEEIRPRTLDLDDADPIANLSLSPMNMASPAVNNLLYRPVRDVAGVRQPPEALAGGRAHAKRQKMGLGREESTDFMLGGGDPMNAEFAQPALPQRQNSMADTKILFGREGRS